MIILTGSSGGIGREIAGELSSIDNIIAIYGSKKPNFNNKKIRYYQLDLSSEKEILDFYSFIEKKYKNITIIHAATLSFDELAAKISIEKWDEVININLRAVFLLNKLIVRKMINDNWGRIIQLSSITATRGVAGTVAYSTSKSALIGLSRVFAKEYAKFGITSNVISLGYFDSGLIETLSDKMKEKIIKEIPSGKLGNCKNITNAINFLINSEYVNGSVISIDGGL
jgi:NAD(P)-dependent dehydrogenase (short-subunit alcohol dehydrogenase family)